MATPDRSSAVRSFYAAHPEYFTAERHDENRRASLPFLIAHLENVYPEDRGQWGVLVKTDRNNKIPCDVLVWRETLDHFDVCDSSQGIWIPHGSIRINGGEAWFWAPSSVVDPSGEEKALQGPPYDAPSVPIPGTPVPNPGTPSPVDLGPVLAAHAELKGLIAALGAKVDQILTTERVCEVLPPTFPVYRGNLSIRYLGNAAIELKPEGQ